MFFLHPSKICFVSKIATVFTNIFLCLSIHQVVDDDDDDNEDKDCEDYEDVDNNDDEDADVDTFSQALWVLR